MRKKNQVLSNPFLDFLRSGFFISPYFKCHRSFRTLTGFRVRCLLPNLSASADLKAFRHFATSVINRFVGLFHIVLFSFACSFKRRQGLFRPIGKLRTLTGLKYHRLPQTFQRRQT
jgi:hypothetical protein